MKNLLIIISTIIISFFGINKLNAEVYQSTSADISYYNKSDLTSWISTIGCGSSSICYYQFPSSLNVYSFYYLTHSKPNILKQGKVYDLYFTFSLNVPEEYLHYSLSETITNIFIGLKPTGAVNDSVASILNWVVVSQSKTTATLKITFRANVVPEDFGVGIGFNSTYGSAYGYSVNQIFQLDENSEYLITSGLDNLNQTQQETNNKLDNLNTTQQETNNKLDDLNDNLTDDNISGAEGSANDFFGNFDDNDYGLSDIVKMPLNFINNITSATCTPLSFPLPFVNTNVELPCMYNIYQQYFGSILSVYQTITFGMVAYWVCINFFRIVKNFKNPDSDEVEVLDL